MCNFVTYQDARADGKLHCIHCGLGEQRFRLVRDCWYQGCVQYCRFFDETCVPKEGASSKDRASLCVLRERFPHLRYHRIVSHQPGRCAYCGGSGLAEQASQCTCPMCEGDGYCRFCGGDHARREVEVPRIDRPRDW